jgi:predicted transcriptional regulator
MTRASLKRTISTAWVSSDGHEIPLTQEFLAIMLDTGRPGVTITMQELERRGWITHRRGVVTISTGLGKKLQRIAAVKVRM